MSAKTTDHADVVIVGAGPAGATAAISLAAAGRSVILLDRAKFPRSKPCAGWLNAKAADLLSDMGLATKDLDLHPIEKVSFHNADLDKSVTPKTEKCPGYVVDRTAFDQGLVRAARAAGADFRDEKRVTSVRPVEQGVEVGIAGGGHVSGRRLIVAAGLAPALMNDLDVALPADSAPTWFAHVEKKRKAKKGVPVRLSLVLGVTPANGFCMVIEAPDRLSLTLSTRGERASLPPLLVEIARGLAAKGIVPDDLSEQAASAPCAATFPYSALDFDSHVGKHTLVVGDTGGFCASVSHEGLFPAMWSAHIAARVIQQTTKATFSQDVLMTFDTKWRLEMAEFLRPPNTELPLLLPLVFTNQAMADRLAAAFFTGENI